MNRRTATTLAVLAVLLTAALVSSGQAGATAPTNETLVLQRDANHNEIGWSASGAFTDAGSWTSDFRAVGGIPSGGFETELKTTETGTAGTLRMQFQGRSEKDGSFDGTWQVIGGTGAYSNLHGGGSWTLAADPSTGVLTFTCPGRVHFD